METRLVQLVPATTTNGAVTALYALDADGNGTRSIKWETVVTTRK
jgi:hypothetical protein